MITNQTEKEVLKYIEPNEINGTSNKDIIKALKHFNIECDDSFYIYERGNLPEVCFIKLRENKEDKICHLIIKYYNQFYNSYGYVIESSCILKAIKKKILSFLEIYIYPQYSLEKKARFIFR